MVVNPEAAEGERCEGEAAGQAHSQTSTIDPPRSAALAPGWPSTATPGPLPPINPTRYQFVREHARGGLGRILAVRDLRLGRVVAVKEILSSSDTAYTRFVREAMITARLEHPAIVPVYDIGRWPSGEPFYSMKLISGRSLYEVIRATPSLAGRLALLPNVIAVADAIAYAHSQGVIHRDLKPANVLVGAFGETVVIDWGIAKDLREAAAGPGPGSGEVSSYADTLPGHGSLTVAGAVIGTVNYMPPEQASGGAVDERSDVYALGAMLHEVLTGTPPYAGAAEPVSAVLAGPPPPAEAQERAIPAELAAIVRKAMARRPGDRYPSARELAEDLRRFQTGRLVSVHVYSRRTLAKRWLRRYRALVAVAATALAILAVGGAVSVQRVVAQRDVAQRRANQLVLTQARGLIERDATRALAWLRTYPDDGEDQAGRRALAIGAASQGIARHVPPRDGFFTFTADGRAWIGAQDGEHIDLHDAASGDRIGRWPHHGRVENIVAVPDGHTLAVLDDSDTAITLLDLATGRARRLPGHPSSISELAAAPDGRWVASASPDGMIRLAPTGPGEARLLSGHDGEVTSLVFSRNGRWLFSMAQEGAAARLWEIDGSVTRVLTGARDVVAGDVSADGALVAFAHRDGEVSLWSTATGEQVRSLGHHASAANAVAFSPDGRWIASVGDDGNLIVTSLAVGSQRTLASRGALTGIAFSPDGALIASGGAAGEVRLWQVDGDEERVLGQHAGRVFRLTFSSDGRHLATQTTTTAEGVNARIWDVATLGYRGLRCHRAAVYTVAISPDGRRMATGGEDTGVCLWDPRTGDSQRFEGHHGTVYAVALSPDGARLASVSFDGTVGIWDLGACASLPGCTPALQVLAGHRGLVWDVAFSPDGRMVASAGDDATVRLWDAASGAARTLVGHSGAVLAVAFSPDGRRLASAGEDRDLRIWDVATGAGVPLRGHSYRINRLAFSSDGRTLWTTSWDQTMRRWDVATGASRAVALRLGTVPVFALSPDQRWLAAADDRGRIALVDPSTLAVHVIGDHRTVVRRLEFSRDGAMLASAGREHTVRLWDVQRAALEAELQTDFEVYNIAFSPDGRWVTAVGDGAVVRSWPTPNRGVVPSDPGRLAGWMATLSTAALDPHEQSP
jgi:WD40 repeat protein